MGCCFARDRSSLTSDDAEDGLTVGKNRPLVFERVKWKSDIPITEHQLRSKRDEFWDTAPAFDGRKEIWDALRAALTHAEQGDLALAQAILDGANISLPDGTLRECYDELGNRYQIPLYCLSSPVNLVEDQSEETSSIGGGLKTSNDDDVIVIQSDPTNGNNQSVATIATSSDAFLLKFRVVSAMNRESLRFGAGDDIKMLCRRGETVLSAKNRLHQQCLSQASKNAAAALAANGSVVAESLAPNKSAVLHTNGGNCDAKLKNITDDDIQSADSSKNNFPIEKAMSTADSLQASTSSPTVASGATSSGSSIPSSDRQQWLYGGRVMRDRNPLSEYRLGSGHVIQVLLSERSFHNGAAASTSGTSSTSKEHRRSYPSGNVWRCREQTSSSSGSGRRHKRVAAGAAPCPATAILHLDELNPTFSTLVASGASSSGIRRTSDDLIDQSATTTTTSLLANMNSSNDVTTTTTTSAAVHRSSRHTNANNERRRQKHKRSAATVTNETQAQNATVIAHDASNATGQAE